MMTTSSVTSSLIGVGVNGAGKTTQLQIITGSMQPDGGEILKQKANMKIAYLTQEFDVETTRTVRVSTSLCPPPPMGNPLRQGEDRLNSMNGLQLLHAGFIIFVRTY